jgi:hypothetical protein
MKFLRTILQSPATGSIARGGYAIVKNQPTAAPILAGSSVAAALGMILVGGYGMFDCIRFQSRHGQCDESVRQDGGMFGAGVMMLLGNWGFFNTYNKKLHAEDKVAESTDKRELVDGFPIAPVFTPIEPTREEIINYMASGATQTEAAKFFGVSRYQIRKALNESKEQNRGRGR